MSLGPETARDPAGPSPPRPAVTPRSSTTSRRTAASTTPPTARPWPNYATAKWPKRSPGITTTTASTPPPHRDDALQQAVDAWADDVAAGHTSGLYAWRRADVAALNQRARAWMQDTGRLTGPEVVFPGGNAYRSGDRVVTLAPGPDGRLVTSERAVIYAVEPSGGSSRCGPTTDTTSVSPGRKPQLSVWGTDVRQRSSQTPGDTEERPEDWFTTTQG